MTQTTAPVGELRIGDRVRVYRYTDGVLDQVSMMVGHGPNHVATVTDFPLCTSFGGEVIVPLDGQRVPLTGRVEVVAG